MSDTKSTETNQPAQTKSKLGFLNIVSDIGQILLILALVLVSIAGFGARIPFLAQQGLQFYAVTSGSMEPTIPTGALIKVGQYELDKLSEGDIITYTAPSDNANQPNIVTHRIDAVDKQEEIKLIGEGEDQSEKKVVTYQFTTKGDANNTVDQAQVNPGDILGKYQWHVPLIGYVSAFSQTSTGFITLVIIPAIILIVWEVTSLVMHFKQKSLADSQAEIDQLKKQLKEKESES
jgi:signal peptidase